MRNQTIDIAKGIGILTVVLCHNWILYDDRGELSRIIFSFHMPLFFFISGIFFKPNLSFQDTIISKAGALLKPYLTIIVGLFIVDYLLFQTKNYPFNISHTLVRGLYSSTFTLDWVQLWFLTHLFAIYLFAWLLHNALFKKIKNRNICIFVLLVIFYTGIEKITSFWSASFNPFGINSFLYGNQPILLGLPFNLDILLVTTPIFFFGFIFSKEILAFKFNPYFFWLSLFTFTSLHYQFNDTMGLHQRQYDSFIVTTIEMVTGIYLVLGISSIFAYQHYMRKILAYLGSASLFILIFHFSIQHKITGVLQYRYPEYSYLSAIFAFIASIIYSLVIYEIVNKSTFFNSFFFAKPSIKHNKIVTDNINNNLP